MRLQSPSCERNMAPKDPRSADVISSCFYPGALQGFCFAFYLFEEQEVVDVFPFVFLFRVQNEN